MEYNGSGASPSGDRDVLQASPNWPASLPHAPLTRETSEILRNNMNNNIGWKDHIGLLDKCSQIKSQRFSGGLRDLGNLKAILNNALRHFNEHCQNTALKNLLEISNTSTRLRTIWNRAISVLRLSCFLFCYILFWNMLWSICIALYAWSGLPAACNLCVRRRSSGGCGGISLTPSCSPSTNPPTSSPQSHFHLA